MSEPKFIAIKVQGIDHWVWFEKIKVTEGATHFEGTEGWGKYGALTNINVKKSQIEGRIESDTLQY